MGNDPLYVKQRVESLLFSWLNKIIWLHLKWSPGQPNGNGTAAYYSTDSQVSDAKETKTGIAGVCVQEIVGETTTSSKFLIFYKRWAVVIQDVLFLPVRHNQQLEPGLFSYDCK